MKNFKVESKCEIHGEHDAWMHPSIEPDMKQIDVFCVKCWMDFLKQAKIGHYVEDLIIEDRLN